MDREWEEFVDTVLTDIERDKLARAKLRQKLHEQGVTTLLYAVFRPTPGPAGHQEYIARMLKHLAWREKMGQR